MALLLALGLMMQQSPAPPSAEKPAPIAPRKVVPRTRHQTVMTVQSPAFLAKRVAGVWEQTERNEEGLGVTLHLNPDGSASLSSGILEDLNYNFDGKELIVVDADEPDDVKQISKVELTGDHLKETNTENGLTAEFVRISVPVSGNPLVGEWKRDLAHLPAPEAAISNAEKERRMAIARNGRYYYKSDGRLFVRIPLTVEQGKWSISPQGKLELQFGTKAQESTVEFDEDEMVLKSSGGTEENYRRPEY